MLALDSLPSIVQTSLPSANELKKRCLEPGVDTAFYNSYELYSEKQYRSGLMPPEAEPNA